MQHSFSPGLSFSLVHLLRFVLFNKIVIHATAQMATEKEAGGISRVHMYESKCILPLQDNCLKCFVLKHTNTTFFASDLLCPFTCEKSCALVNLPVLMLKNMLGSIFSCIRETCLKKQECNKLNRWLKYDLEFTEMFVYMCKICVTSTRCNAVYQLHTTRWHFVPQ